MHIAIVGSGIAGLAAALELERRGHRDYAIYERDSVAGGLCRSHCIDGYLFDSVSHVLHFQSADVRQRTIELVRGGLVSAERDAAIYYLGRYVPYPFQTHLGFLPLKDGLACLAGIIAARARAARRPPQTFADWIYGEFGAGIARHFMLPYNRRLWGVDPAEMSLDWMRFVPKAPLRPVLASFLSGRTRQGYNAEFLYPASGGIQSLIDGMASRVSPIRFRRQVTAIDPGKRRLCFEDGGSAGYDVLISTIPLNRLAEICEGTPEALRAAGRQLRVVPIASITYGLRRPINHSHHWVYFPEAEFPFFRLFFNSNVDPQSAPAGASLISAEFANVPANDLEGIKTRTMAALQQLGFLSGPMEIAFTHSSYFACGYPVHDLSRKAAVGKLLEYFDALGIRSIGRFGGWRYCGIEDGFLDAAEVVESILADRHRTLPTLDAV